MINMIINAIYTYSYLDRYILHFHNSVIVSKNLKNSIKNKYVKINDHKRLTFHRAAYQWK